jgi:hypothetical protein
MHQASQPAAAAGVDAGMQHLLLLRLLLLLADGCTSNNCMQCLCY